MGVISTMLVTSAALWEGDKRTPYKDIAGILTVCHGYTGSDIIKNKVYTKEECNALLKKELLVHAEGVLKCVNVPLTQYQFDAYVLFTYNVGVGAFCKSGVLRTLNAGKYTEACYRLANHADGSYAWSYADGRYAQGLQNRRQYERKMCLGQLNPISS